MRSKISAMEWLSLCSCSVAVPSAAPGGVEFRDARVMIWADGLIERTTAFLDIDEARAAAERLARERG